METALQLVKEKQICDAKSIAGLLMVDQLKRLENYIPDTFIRLAAYWLIILLMLWQEIWSGVGSPTEPLLMELYRACLQAELILMS